MDYTRWSQMIRAIQGHQISDPMWWTQCDTETIALREFLIRWKFPQQEQSFLYCSKVSYVLLGLFLSKRATNVSISTQRCILGRKVESHSISFPASRAASVGEMLSLMFVVDGTLKDVEALSLQVTTAAWKDFERLMFCGSGWDAKPCPFGFLT